MSTAVIPVVIPQASTPVSGGANAAVSALASEQTSHSQPPGSGAAAKNAAAICFHCGLPVPAGTHWQVAIESVAREMCCPGCAAIAESIVESGLGDYYRTRVGFSATAAGQERVPRDLVPEQLRLYDSQRAITSTGDEGPAVEATYSVEDIRCAACVWLIEHKIARMPGVQAASMNFTTGRLRVAWLPASCKPSDILNALRQIGYTAYPFDPARQGMQLERATKTLFRRLFIAGLSMMQVMMFALPVYLATDGTMDAATTSLMRWAMLLLSVPALVYSARPFYQGAWTSLRNRLPGMDVPVTLGIAAALAGSLAAIWRGSGDVYFDSITMFIFFLLCSRYLELVARRKAASALEALHRALPASAWLMPGYPADCEPVLVPADQLREGDVILVKPGETIAADGTLLEGETSVDLSLLTGESRAQRKTVGASLPGGAVNATQPVVVRVERVASESTLSGLVRLTEKAGHTRPQISLWADRAAAWFVTLLLLFSVGVFVGWQWVDPARAWPVAIAVLVVSCPCALSLATPTALAVATERLLRQGILVVQPHVLETLHRATHVVFDKTGTLTVGRPVLQRVEALEAARSEWCLQVAAALERSSAHPLGWAIVEAARAANATDAATGSESRSGLGGRSGTRETNGLNETNWTNGRNGTEASSAPDVCVVSSPVHHVAGQGLEGVVDGMRFRLGSMAFVQAMCAWPTFHFAPTGHELSAKSSQADDATCVYLGTDAGMLARFVLVDALRSDSHSVVQYFKGLGKQVILLSGDRQEVAQNAASTLGMDAAHGATLPEAKVAFVQALQKAGAVVAMVGDGINDAAVLAAADVSFAMGGGTALAQLNADCVLLSGSLSSLCEVADSASRTFAVIRQNLAWATLYNVIAIPAAAIGWINPWLSAIGMSASSAVVVANALRLRRHKRQTAHNDGGISTGLPHDASPWRSVTPPTPPLRSGVVPDRA
ncbi:MAG: cadA [Herminiimonas sp.]|nr:cadA [Herminiimonas sp.]